MSGGPIQLEYARPRRGRFTREHARLLFNLIVLVGLTLGTSFFVLATTVSFLVGQFGDAAMLALFGSLLALQSSLWARHAPRPMLMVNLAMLASLVLGLVTALWLS